MVGWGSAVAVLGLVPWMVVWSATPPSTAQGTFPCNFETDFCAWTQDSTDDFDWMRNMGSTKSSNTGPPADHTSGSGYYAYIEASTPRRQNDTARLVSPLFNGSAKCLTFWYYMYGSGMGNLSVYNRSGPSQPLGTPVFKQSGSQGRFWLRANVDLRSTAPLQVVIEATRGSDFHGDIAIDDISFADGQCPKVQGILPCNFDTNFCAWTQDSTDDFDWMRNIGSTNSSYTGPPADNIFGTGYYAYIEASTPRRQNDTARLVSPLFNGSATCLTFWYHMYGSSMGNLSVYNRSGPSQPLGTPVFRRSGSQGQKWLQANVDLSSTAPLQVVIEATRGSDFKGDIAIDDISFTDRQCPRATAYGNIRLVDGLQPWEGRVEIYRNGQWGTVCDDLWSRNDAIVVCLQLGLNTSYAQAFSWAYFGPGSGSIVLNGVQCRGHESRLTECRSWGDGNNNCGHSEDAGVSCQPPDQRQQCGLGSLTAYTRSWSLLSSYGYPRTYPSGSDCMWVIQTQPGSGYIVELRVIDINLAGDGYNCQRDNVTIYDGGWSAGSKRLATLCQTGDRRLYSSGSSMGVRFQSGQYPRGRGFRLYYKAFPSPSSYTTTTTTTTTTTRRSVAKTTTTPMVPYNPPESHPMSAGKAAYAIGLSVTGVIFMLIVIVACRICYAKRNQKPPRGATTAVQMANNDVYFLPGSRTGARSNLAFSSPSLPDLYLPPAYPSHLPPTYPSNLPTACSPDQPPAYDDLKHDPLPSYTEAMTVNPLSAHFNAVPADTQ